MIDLYTIGLCASIFLSHVLFNDLYVLVFVHQVRGLSNCAICCDYLIWYIIARWSVLPLGRSEIISISGCYFIQALISVYFFFSDTKKDIIRGSQISDHTSILSEYVA